MNIAGVFMNISSSFFLVNNSTLLMIYNLTLPAL